MYCSIRIKIVHLFVNLINSSTILGVFVIISWVSFIIPVEIIAARVVLLVTLTLVLINMFNKVT